MTGNNYTVQCDRVLFHFHTPFPCLLEANSLFNKLQIPVVIFWISRHNVGFGIVNPHIMYDFIWHCRLICKTNYVDFNSFSDPTDIALMILHDANSISILSQSINSVAHLE